jgi:hypothetical protein
MAGGFPVVPSLLAFGPRKLKNEGSATNSDTEASAEMLNLWKWQIAGLGMAVAKAWVVVASDGSWIADGAVWNPTGDVSLKPTTAQTATGIYTVEWATQYVDEEGTNRAITLYGGVACPQSTTANLVAVANIVNTTCTVKITTANTGAAADAKFLLFVI